MAEVIHTPWIKPQEARLHQEFRLTPHTIFLMHLNEGAGAVAADASIHGNDGAITLATWVPGRIGSGLRFNGLANVTIPDSPIFNGLVEITVEVFMTPANVAAGNRRIVSRRNDWFVRQEAAEIRWYINGGAINFATVTGPLTAGVESYVSCTYDGSIAWINVDGVRLVSSAIVTPIPPSANPIEIGRFNPPSSELYIGDLDEIHMQNRAISYGEEIAHFNSSQLARQL